MGVSTAHRINLSMWILIYSFSDTHYVWAACGLRWKFYGVFSLTWPTSMQIYNIGTKESVCIRKEFNSHRTGLGHQHGRHFIVFRHKYGCRDVMWKHSIRGWLVCGHYVLFVLFCFCFIPFLVSIVVLSSPYHHQTDTFGSVPLTRLQTDQQRGCFPAHL